MPRDVFSTMTTFFKHASVSFAVPAAPTAVKFQRRITIL
jgi:hypothetical protein